MILREADRKVARRLPFGNPRRSTLESPDSPLLSHQGSPRAGTTCFSVHSRAAQPETVPMFVIAGNHDVRGDSSRLFERYFEPRELAFTYRNSPFVLLDDSLEPFDDADYARLEESLRDHPDVQHRFLFMHVQPIHWEGEGK